MRALLELLNNEKDIVTNIEKCDWQAVEYDKQRAEIEAISIDCDYKTNDLKRLDEKMVELSHKRLAYRDDLELIRNEIRDYFSMLIGKGDKE